MDIPARAPWTALVMRVPPAAEELLVAGLSDYLQGERRVDLPPGKNGEAVELWLYLHSPADTDAALAEATRWLDRTGLDAAACDLRAEIVEDERWVERYQASLLPFDIGSGYRVFPSGKAEAAGGRKALILVPGRAFGTGEHPTTRLCTAALERHVDPGSRWIDVGCGTAILSIVARGCGAGRVLACDTDPEAITVAEEVLAMNEVDGVEVRLGSADEGAPDTWDGVVVNISAPFVIDHAARLAGLPRPGGVLLASGFLEQDLDAIRGAFERAGLECLGTDVEAPWGLAEFRRPD